MILELNFLAIISGGEDFSRFGALLLLNLIFIIIIIIIVNNNNNNNNLLYVRFCSAQCLTILIRNKYSV